MLKPAIVLIAIFVAAVFLTGVSFFAVIPAILYPLLALITIAPSLPLLLSEHVKSKKRRTRLQRIGEMIVIPYLYLLIFLLAHGCLFIFYQILGSPPPFLVIFLISAIQYVLVLICGALHARKIKTRRYTLDFMTDTSASHLRAVFFSDLHLGYFTTDALLERLSDAIIREKPDIVFFAGDLFDSAFSELRNPEKATDCLKKIAPPLGFYACQGNHDAYSENETKRVAFERACGITMLEDNGVSLESIDIYGRIDVKKDRVNAQAAVCKKDKPLIILDHEPKETEKLIDAGADLVLSGHTHNGQTFPGNVLSRIAGRYNYGLHRYKNKYALTTAGAGYWGVPMRLFTCNEIVVLDLNFDNKK